MALFCSFNRYPISLKIDRLSHNIEAHIGIGKGRRSIFSVRSCALNAYCQSNLRTSVSFRRESSFFGGSRLTRKQKATKLALHRRRCAIQASLLSGSHLASSVFTLGTAAVLPFYTLMVVAPNSTLTKKSIESNVPYILLGALYAFLLYRSWTPETLRLIFASKYLLPELPGIAKMFSSEMTLASAWIHLLVVDLFAARQVFHDGLENRIETRHSVSLCLMFCPIGILTHFITKALTKNVRSTNHQI